MFDAVKISQLPETFSIVSQDYLVVNVDDKVSSKLSYQNFLDTLTSENLIWDGNLVFTGNVVLPEGAETDPLFTASPAFTITQEDIDRWNEAYSWGDHALEGYIKAHQLPSGYIMPGDPVSLLENDPPYVTESELNTIIDGLDFITLDELNIILDGHGYIKPGDPVSLLDNDVPYLTESSLRCILEGLTAGCNPDPNSRGYLKRAVNGIPQDNVSELFNDVPYLTEASFENISREFLWRRDSDGNFRDDNIELANGMGYLEHTWDGNELFLYDLEILSNTDIRSPADGEVLTREGDYWVNSSPMLSVAGLHFEGAVDVGLPAPTTYTKGAVVVQHHVSEQPRIAQLSWNFLNPTATREVQEQQYMILLESGQWVLCGQWNDQLQTDWLQADVWHPAYLRNKPTKLSDIDPNLPDVIGDGKISVSGGFGVNITGDGGTANQEADTDQKIDLVAGDGISIDGNGINVEWDANVGDGAINLYGGTGIIVRHNQVETPHANQYCDTTTIIEMAAPFANTLNTLQIKGSENLVTKEDLDNAIQDLGDVFRFKGAIDFTTTPAPADAQVGDVYGSLTDGVPDPSWGLPSVIEAGLYGLGETQWSNLGISNIDVDLSDYQTISASEEALNSLSETLNDKIDTAVETLEGVDTALDEKIDTLKEYTDDNIESLTDTINTFKNDAINGDEELSDRLDVLEADPVTKNYVDTNLGYKLSKNFASLDELP